MSKRIPIKPPVARVLRSKNFMNEGMNCSEVRMFRYLIGNSDLKSTKARKKKIKMRVEKTIRNLLSSDEVIKIYILILLILRASRFILPSPILFSIGIYSILSTGTPSIFAAAASPATQSVVNIWDFIETISSFDTP